jgi:hypothetical protein
LTALRERAKVPLGVEIERGTWTTWTMHNQIIDLTESAYFMRIQALRLGEPATIG